MNNLFKCGWICVLTWRTGCAALANTAPTVLPAPLAGCYCWHLSQDASSATVLTVPQSFCLQKPHGLDALGPQSTA